MPHPVISSYWCEIVATKGSTATHFDRYCLNQAQLVSLLLAYGFDALNCNPYKSLFRLFAFLYSQAMKKTRTNF